MERNQFSIKKKNDWKKWENNVPITLNVLHAKKEKICPAYDSKHNLYSKKQVIPLFL